MDKVVKKLKNKCSTLITIVLIIALLVIVLAIFYKGYTSAQHKYEKEIVKLQEEVDRLSDPIATYEEATKEIDINVIQNKIQSIGELATIEYLYTDAGKYENSKQLWGKDVIFTNKSFIAKWDGIIKAGIDVNQISIEIVSQNKEIVIKMPQAKILSHEIDDTSFETLDEKNGLFNSIEIDDIRDFDEQSKIAMEKRVIDNGILDKAMDNAKTIISQLIDNDLVQELGYDIRFEVIDN